MLSDSSNNTGKNGNPASSVWRWLAMLELLVAIGLIELAIWTVEPSIRLAAGILAGILAFHCFFAYGRFSSRSGKSDSNISNPGSSARSRTGLNILIATVVISALACTICYCLDLWSPSLEGFSQRSTNDWLMVKIPTVVLQQLLFQLIFIPTLFFVTRNSGLTVVMSAVIFAGLHLPNPLLILLTLIVGLFWFSTAIHRTRLFSLTASHLILAVVIANVADEYVLDMRVGQVCFQKWPKTVESANEELAITVYPRPLLGELSRVTQTNQQVILQGRVFDQARGKAPRSVHLVFGSFDPLDEIGDSWEPQNIITIPISDTNGDFKVALDAKPNAGATEIRLFASHRFGWSYPINDSARIEIVKEDSSGETICLYPKQIRGNIGHIRARNGNTDLIGWGFDWQQRKSLDNLLMLANDELVSLELKRRTRKEIAAYFEDSRLLNCGFVTRLPQDPDSFRPVIYARNSEGVLERMSMELARPPEFRIVNQKKRALR